LGGQSDLLSRKIYGEMLVRILLVLESLGSNLGHRLTLEKKIFFGFSI
jgi:hypothetical protein